VGLNEQFSLEENIHQDRLGYDVRLCQNMKKKQIQKISVFLMQLVTFLPVSFHYLFNYKICAQNIQIWH